MNYIAEIQSPLHIGTGKSLTPLEFALSDREFVVMSLDKILGTDSRLAQRLNDDLNLKGSKFSLTSFLKAYAPHTLGVRSEQRPASGSFAALRQLKSEESKQVQDSKAFRKYTVTLDGSVRRNILDGLERNQNVDVKEHLKTEPGWEAYLPGSSLKGAFRTALAYYLFKTEAHLYQQLKQRLCHKSGEAVNELIFYGAQQDPKYDLFKILRFSDSEARPVESCLEIKQMKILSLSNGGREPLKPWWTFFEVVKPGITFMGTVHIENRLLEKTATDSLGWKGHQHKFSLAQLVESANQMALDVCAWELRFFQEEVKNLNITPVIKFYQNLKQSVQNSDSQTCYLCLGQGAGWHKMTVGMLLEKDPQFFRELRRRLRLANHRLEFVYPKSRKVLMKESREVEGVFGWIKIKFKV